MRRKRICANHRSRPARPRLTAGALGAPHGMFARAMLCALIVAMPVGCARKTIHIRDLPASQNTISREELEAKLLTNNAFITSIYAYVEGDIVTMQREAGGTEPKTRTGAENAEWSGTLTNGRFMASRSSKSPWMTRFVAEFPMLQATFSLLANGRNFWIRPPRPTAQLFKGTHDNTFARPEGWPTLRPQDLGVLLLCDDLFATEESERNVTYMETWPTFYVLHILRPQRKPEVIYSRIWVHRETLQIAYHQLFDADGSVVAEARLGGYKPMSVAGPKRWGRAPDETSTAEKSAYVEIPTEARIFWPKDKVALDIRLKHIRLNQGIEASVFDPPDESKAVVVEIPAYAAPPAPTGSP